MVAGETRRIGDTYTDDRPHTPAFHGDALAAIADELRKLRLLKEYEMGVLVGEDDGSLQIIAGQDVEQGTLRFCPTPAKKGDVLYDEDMGRL